MGFSTMLRRPAAPMARTLRRRGLSSASSSAEEPIVAAVLFERLPVVISKIDPVVYAFQEFSFRWRQQYRRRYPDEVLRKADARGKGDYQIDYVSSTDTEDDKTNDRKMNIHSRRWLVHGRSASELSSMLWKENYHMNMEKEAHRK